MIILCLLTLLAWTVGLCMGKRIGRDEREAEITAFQSRLRKAIQELTAIQYFNTETHKHRAWAWDALNAIAPDLAEMPAQEAFSCSRDARYVIGLQVRNVIDPRDLSE